MTIRNILENLANKNRSKFDMLTPEQTKTYGEIGLVKIESAFSKADAGSVVDSIWSVLTEKFGARRGDPASWNISMGYGFGELKQDPAFQKVGSPRTIGAIDDVMGKGRWRHPSNWGQMLVTFPIADKRWSVPTEIWHTDFGFSPVPDPFGTLLFGFLSDVQTHGGGTVVIEGSHKLVRKFVSKHPQEFLNKMKRVRLALMNSEPWLRDLAKPGDPDRRNERFLNTEIVSGIPMRVVELVGQPGDIVLCHPWMLHAVAPNCSSTPRMMFVQRIQMATE